MIKALLLILLAGPAFAAIKTETIEYKDGDAVLQGFLAYDDAKAKRPGVAVIHEWMGLGDNAKNRARMLAELGYTAFAIDMYGKGVYAKDHEEAGKMSGTYRNDRKLMRRRALAGLSVLQNRKETDAKRLAAIGYCFGGTTALELARAGAELKGVASFHGGLETTDPAVAGVIKAKVAVYTGADDKWTAGGVPGFEDEMRKANADYFITSYGGAVHSFTVKEAGDDPSKGMAYNAAADKRSWESLKDFLAETLK